METLNSNDIHRDIMTPARRRLRRRGCFLLLAVALIIVNAAISALIVEWRTPEIVMFDMKGTIDRFMDQSSRKSLDEATSHTLTERFTTNLNRSIEDWQVSHNALILVTPAVVGGARDITHDVQRDVAQKMQAGQ